MNTFASRYIIFKSWLALHYKPLILSLVVACVSFPKYDLFFADDVDRPLPWAFNFFADGHYQLSRELIFPHGRLSFLLFPLPVGHNLMIAIAVTLLCSVLFSMNLFKLAGKLSISIFLFVLIIHSVIDLQFTLVGLVFSHILLFRDNDRIRHLLTATFFSVLALYVKSYCGTICCLIFACEFVALVLFQKRFRQGFSMAGAFLVFFYAFWLGLYQTFSGSFTFFLGQAQLISDNSEAVGYSVAQPTLLLFISFASLILLPVLSKNKRATYFFVLMLPAAFATWKYSIARCDDSHLSIMLNYLVVFVFSLFMLLETVRLRVLLTGLFSIIAFMLVIFENKFQPVRELSILKPTALYDLVVNYDEVCRKSREHSLEATNKRLLPPDLLQLIGKQTADVYPWDYAIIARNAINWQPRPVFHSYAAYTPWLDWRNAEHFQSGKASKFLIWELNSITSTSTMKMESIDGRYLLNDEPEALLTLYSNYDLCHKDQNYLVYKRRATPLPVQRSFISTPKTIATDTWMEVPACEPGSVLRMKLEIKKSFSRTLGNFFYKGDLFFIDYELENKNTVRHRIVPKNAKDGLWIYPFMMNPATSYDVSQNVKKIKISSTGNRDGEPEYVISFEKISFDRGRINFLQHAFGDTLAPDTLAR